MQQQAEESACDAWGSGSDALATRIEVSRFILASVEGMRGPKLEKIMRMRIIITQIETTIRNKLILILVNISSRLTNKTITIKTTTLTTTTTTTTTTLI